MPITYIFDELNSILETKPLSPSVFIGSLGFEDRCLCAIEQFLHYNSPRKIIFLTTYGSDTETEGHNERLDLQLKNRSKLLEIAEGYEVTLLDCLIDTPQEAFDKTVTEIGEDSNDLTIFIDFSSMPKQILFPFIRILWLTLNCNIVGLYSTPDKYTSDELFYGLGEPKILSGFLGDRNTEVDDKPEAWIPVLGFDGKSASLIYKKFNFAKVLPIIAFPGYQDAIYINRIIYENRELLSKSEVERIYYSTANNPFRAIDLIERLINRLAGYNIVLSPIGPKPHSLGICLAAMEHRLRVVHSQPWAYNPQYSTGCKNTYAYVLRFSTNHDSL